MKSFLDLSLRAKLFALLGVVVALFSLALVNAFRTTVGLLAIEGEAQSKQMDAIAFAKMDSNRNDTRVEMLMLLNVADAPLSIRQRRAEHIQELTRQNADFRHRLADRNRKDEWMYSRLERYEAMVQVFNRVRDGAVNDAVAGRFAEARAISLGEQDQRFDALRVLGDEMFQRTEEQVKERVQAAEAATEHAKRVYLIAASGMLVVAVFAVWGLGHLITEPLRELLAAIRRISTGDLRANLEMSQRRDEIGQLAHEFQTMVDSLRGMQRQVQEGVNVLATSASEIFTATAQIAASATETATAVSQTTATAEEVKQTAQVAAQKAGNVADIAQRAAQSAQTGRRAIDASMAGMQNIREQMESIAETVIRLSEQSQAIGEIIASVNDLAEQSNLLAVNASIEAAKAGEHGRGFAVVAQEIRNLSTQSKEATTQVRNILNDIQRATTAAVMAAEQGSKAVEAGVRQVNESGEAIRTLAESIVSAAQAATQITASTQEQLIGIDQVTIAIQNILQASRQNATATQQAESGAKTLNQLGQNLKVVAQKFAV